jgi:hypothetical protein
VIELALSAFLQLPLQVYCGSQVKGCKRLFAGMLGLLKCSALLHFSQRCELALSRILPLQLLLRLRLRLRFRYAFLAQLMREGVVAKSSVPTLP